MRSVSNLLIKHCNTIYYEKHTAWPALYTVGFLQQHLTYIQIFTCYCQIKDAEKIVEQNDTFNEQQSVLDYIFFGSTGIKSGNSGSPD